MQKKILYAVFLFLLTQNLMVFADEVNENKIESVQEDLRNNDPCEYVREKLSNSFDVSINIPSFAYITDGYTSELFKKFNECIQQKQDDSLSFHYNQVQMLLRNLDKLSNDLKSIFENFDELQTTLITEKKELQLKMSSSHKLALQEHIQKLDKDRFDQMETILEKRKEIASAYQECVQYVDKYNFAILNSKLTNMLSDLQKYDEHMTVIENEINKRM